MNIIRRTLELDSETDSRLRGLAAERGQDIAVVLAEAVALLESVISIEEPEIAGDRRRLDEFMRTREAIPFSEVEAWVAGWGAADKRPRPIPRKIG